MSYKNTFIRKAVLTTPPSILDERGIKEGDIRGYQVVPYDIPYVSNYILYTPFTIRDVANNNDLFQLLMKTAKHAIHYENNDVLTYTYSLSYTSNKETTTFSIDSDGNTNKTGMKSAKEIFDIAKTVYNIWGLNREVVKEIYGVFDYTIDVAFKRDGDKLISSIIYRGDGPELKS